MFNRDLLPDDQPFALAFSGGGDSLALLSALKSHPSLAAVIHVDHGLRDESAAEAEQARKLAHSLDHKLIVLRWKPKARTTGLQEQARRARYGLLGDYCRQAGIGRLVTAHHADDQAETTLMRLQRGSGWRGAAGMRPVRYAPVWPELAGIKLVRPALNLSREGLRAELGSLEPVQDPSNDNQAYARVRVRAELQDNASLRSDMLQLADEMAQGLRQEQAFIRHDLRGYSLSHEGLFQVPRLIQPVTLALLAPIIGGQSGPADRSRIAEKIIDLKKGEKISIGEGCVGHWDGDILSLMRDRVAITGRRDRRLAPSAVPIELSSNPVIWDGRFLVSARAGQLWPTERQGHVGYKIVSGQGVKVQNLVKERLEAELTGM